MIGRTDIEESKINVAMNASLSQASHPCGNFSEISSLKLLKAKGSIGHAYAVYPHLVEFLHFDIHSTGQKSHYVITC